MSQGILGQRRGTSRDFSCRCPVRSSQELSRSIRDRPGVAQRPLGTVAMGGLVYTPEHGLEMHPALLAHSDYRVEVGKDYGVVKPNFFSQY